MDPERIHSYLQAACAGLGFDIGEVWFSAVEERTKLGAVLNRHVARGMNAFEPTRTIKFLQLYTSKSYGDPQDLIKPETDEGEQTEKKQPRKHVLSPTLVNAIATNAQVVWANCQKQEGLLGKSDMRLQTAVGMPVAMDCYGNMCIVVMFSLKSVQSTKEAMEFIKLISQGAASSKIPCLLPVVDSSQKQLAYDPKKFRDWQRNEAYLQQLESQRTVLSGLNRNGSTAVLPKDQYGIPILPDFAELLTDSDGINSNSAPKRLSFLAENSDTNDDFDNSTFGLWSTIMNGPNNTNKKRNESSPSPKNDVNGGQPLLYSLDQKRRVRLEEFVTAFLGFSLFEIADVWAPKTDVNGVTTLHNVFTANSEETDTFPNVALFKNISKNTVIKPWSGAVGRAYSTASAVWSTYAELVVDNERKSAFFTTKINTVLALPITSHDAIAPSCVIAFYSLVRTDSSTFVLKFLQQALHTLWEGLDSVDPHESIGTEQWQGVSAADIGEMAADVDLQRALYNRKRTHDLMQETTAASASPVLTKRTQRSSSLVDQLQALTGDAAVKDVNDSQTFSFATNDLFSLQNLAAAQAQVAQQASVQQIGANPNFFRDDQKLYVDCNNVVVQQDEGKVFRNGQTNYGLDPNNEFCLPIATPSHKPENPIQHPTVSKINKSRRVCRIEGCDEASVARRPYCSRHSGNRLCEFVGGCTKCAQGATRFCIAHGGGRRCTFPGCDKGARDKFFCAAHGGGKRCKMDGCNKSAVGGSKLCTSHGGGRRCAVEGCSKSAQSSTKFCVKHGGGKKCAHEGCTKVARGRTLFCAGHGGGVRCKLDGCNRIAIGKLQLCRAHGGAGQSQKSQAQEIESVGTIDGSRSQAYLQLQQQSQQQHPTMYSHGM